jgi:hypothetical protein
MSNVPELERHFPDGMIVKVIYAGIYDEHRVEIIKEAKWLGRVVILPVDQLRRWRIWRMEYCPKTFTLGGYRLRAVEYLPQSDAILCVRDNALWWRLPLRNWVRRQREAIWWRIILTLKVWNLVSGVDTSLTIEDQQLIWFPRWRENGRQR